MHRIETNEILGALKGCKDPEMDINVVDLGLLYGIRVDDSNNIVVTMTMTSPMCPVTSVILADAQLRIANIPDVGKVDIDLVWDPAWNPDMIAEEIRIGIM